MKKYALKLALNLLITLNSSIIALSMTSCQPSPQEKATQEARAMQKNILRLNNQGEISSLHPHHGVDLYCRIFQKALFEGLTRVGPNGEVALAGAQSVEISPDQLTYTFHLREMLWSNGERVTASDFEKSWARALEPDSDCLRSDLFYVLKNAKLVKKGELSISELGIHAKDDQTFVVTLEHPAPYFLDLVANSLFSPLYQAEDLATTFNGPFLLEQEDRSMILVKNEMYWDAANVELDEIQISYVADATTAISMYEKGEIDWVGLPFINLPRDAIPKLEKRSDYYSRRISGTYWICCNTQKPPLTSQKIRKALSSVIDRSALMEHVLYKEGQPTLSALPQTLALLNQEQESAQKKEAKRLFEEGLAELGCTRETLPTIQLTHSDIEGQKSLSEALQQIWENELGIEVTLQGKMWNEFFQSLGHPDHHMGGCIWFSMYDDPSYILEFFKEGDNRYNAPKWENAHYAHLLDLANNEIDLAARSKHLQEAENILMDEAPIIPLYIPDIGYLKAERVEGLHLTNLAHLEFKWVKVKKEVKA